MDLTSTKTIRELLLKYNASPSKLMGQNFLKDQLILKKIIMASQLTKKDAVLEIGPGMGTLTKELVIEAKEVIAVEKDKIMVEILKETLKDFNNFNIINGNILKLNLKLPKEYKIVANIPYYLTSPLIRKFLENPPNGNQPKTIILMIQKEVAQRICSNPPHMSLLAISVQFYAKAEIISYVSKKCFWPSPKVDSAIIKITPKVNTEKVDTNLFFKIVKAGFSQPRKQLVNNLSKSLQKNKDHVNNWLLKNNIDQKRRAETLSLNDWINLTNNYL